MSAPYINLHISMPDITDSLPPFMRMNERVIPGWSCWCDTGDEGEPKKGGRGVDHDETLDHVDEILDHVDEMEEFTELWNNLGLRLEVIENWKLNSVQKNYLYNY